MQISASYLHYDILVSHEAQRAGQDGQLGSDEVSAGGEWRSK